MLLASTRSISFYLRGGGGGMEVYQFAPIDLIFEVNLVTIPKWGWFFGTKGQISLLVE